MHLSAKQNIVLIGMPGVGKSTVGVLLAKAMGRDFLDTDVHIQARQGRTLQEMLDAEGIEEFCRIEQEAICALNLAGYVVATGGSVIYGQRAMAHLQAAGMIVHLDLELPSLERRISDQTTRGIVMPKGQRLDELYRQRRPLYLRYADLTIPCGEMTQDQVVAAILARIQT